MMMGPMKKKVVTSAVVTAVIMIILFCVIGAVYVMQTNKTIADLKVKSEVVQRYVFIKDMLAGDVVTASNVALVDVKGESAPSDSFEYLDMIGRRLKMNANSKTIVTDSMFYEDDKEPELDTRLQEFNMITLPSDLAEGDYIDVRLRFPTGEDYAVIVGKKIESVGATAEESNTIFLRLSEEEIDRMGSAIIESYIRDGVHLYANKYVDASTQLFDYTRVDFVKRFEDNRYKIVEVPAEEAISGEEVSGEDVIERKVERTVEEIASLIGLSVNETEDIKLALEKNDETILSNYRSKLITTEKSIAANYPVKVEVAQLIKNNPNILQEIKNKYDVEKLESLRENLPNADIKAYQVDDFGNLILDSHNQPIPKLDDNGHEMVSEEYITSIEAKLEKEIETQKTERQQYLLNLLQRQTASN